MLPQRQAMMERDRQARERLAGEQGRLDRWSQERKKVWAEAAKKQTVGERKLRAEGEWDGISRAACCGAPLEIDPATQDIRLEATGKFADRHKRAKLKPACRAAVLCARLADKQRRAKQQQSSDPAKQKKQAATVKGTQRRIDRERTLEGRAVCCGAPLDPVASIRWRNRHLGGVYQGMELEPCEAAQRCASAAYHKARSKRRKKR